MIGCVRSRRGEVGIPHWLSSTLVVSSVRYVRLPLSPTLQTPISGSSPLRQLSCHSLTCRSSSSKLKRGSFPLPGRRISVFLSCIYNTVLSFGEPTRSQSLARPAPCLSIHHSSLQQLFSYPSGPCCKRKEHRPNWKILPSGSKRLV